MGERERPVRSVADDAPGLETRAGLVAFGPLPDAELIHRPPEAAPLCVGRREQKLLPRLVARLEALVDERRAVPGDSVGASVEAAKVDLEGGRSVLVDRARCFRLALLDCAALAFPFLYRCLQIGGGLRLPQRRRSPCKADGLSRHAACLADVLTSGPPSICSHSWA